MKIYLLNQKKGTVSLFSPLGDEHCVSYKELVLEEVIIVRSGDC